MLCAERQSGNELPQSKLMAFFRGANGDIELRAKPATFNRKPTSFCNLVVRSSLDHTIKPSSRETVLRLARCSGENSSADRTASRLISGTFPIDPISNLNLIFRLSRFCQRILSLVLSFELASTTSRQSSRLLRVVFNARPESLNSAHPQTSSGHNSLPLGATCPIALRCRFKRVGIRDHCTECWQRLAVLDFPKGFS